MAADHAEQLSSQPGLQRGSTRECEAAQLQPVCRHTGPEVRPEALWDVIRSKGVCADTRFALGSSRFC